MMNALVDIGFTGWEAAYRCHCTGYTSVNINPVPGLHQPSVISKQSRSDIS